MRSWLGIWPSAVWILERLPGTVPVTVGLSWANSSVDSLSAMGAEERTAGVFLDWATFV